MSQHRLTGLTPGGKVDVLLGWDSPMSWFFFGDRARKRRTSVFQPLRTAPGVT